MEEQGRNCSCKVSKRMRGTKRMSVDWAEKEKGFSEDNYKYWVLKMVLIMLSLINLAKLRVH